MVEAAKIEEKKDSTTTTTDPIKKTDDKKPADPNNVGGGITLDILKKICPNATEKGLKEGFPLVAAEMAKKGLTSKNQLVAILATVYVETAVWESIEEYGRGGGKHGIYYGRGYIQLTWDYNYEAFGKVIGMDLIGNPDIALKPDIAAQSTIWFWTENGVDKYAEKGDWYNVRSIVNAGSPDRSPLNGMDVYQPCIERGIQFLQSGIDPNNLGVLPGNYGLGCVDASTTTSLSGGNFNPMSNAEAMAQLLGVYTRDASRAYEVRLTLNPEANPSVLKLKPQKTFELKGVGKELEGTYTVDEVELHFHYDGTMLLEVIAHKPDPNAKPPIIFSHNTTIGNAPPKGVTAPTAVAAGDIGGKIFQAAGASRGKSTASGPGGGNVACAYAVNNFCVIPAGIPAIGSNPDFCPSMVEALQGGRGQKVTREQALPGDIWFAFDQHHVGIVMDKGAKTILSNSSSKAAFSWESPIDEVNGFYGGSEDSIWRVVK